MEKKVIAVIIIIIKYGAVLLSVFCVGLLVVASLKSIRWD